MKKYGFIGLVVLFLMLFVHAELNNVCIASPDNLLSEGGRGVWTGTWSTSLQLVEPVNMPPDPGLAGNTLRQIFRVSVGGKNIRMKFSNLFGNEPLTLLSATIAPAMGDTRVNAKLMAELHFEGNDEITLLPNEECWSDPLTFDLSPGAFVAVTLAFGDTPQDLTGHPGSRTTSFLVQGNQSMKEHFEEPVQMDHWYVMSRLDVVSVPEAASVVVLGNSITDGRGSGTNRQNRWTDILSERLLKNPGTEHVGVLNAGIGGNCVLRGGLGPVALDRFKRDVLDQSNVRWLIIMEGINDIGGIHSAAEAPAVADELISAYSRMIDMAHEQGIKVYGATILPFRKSFYDCPYKQGVKDIVNEWIRNGGRFDAMIDFDRLMSDPQSPGTMLPDMHDHDYLHPNEAGHLKMGASVDLSLFKGSL